MITYKEAQKMQRYIQDRYGPPHEWPSSERKGEMLQRIFDNPTTDTIRRLMLEDICHWFHVGPDKLEGLRYNLDKMLDADKKLQSIYRKVVLGGSQ